MRCKVNDHNLEKNLTLLFDSIIVEVYSFKNLKSNSENIFISDKQKKPISFNDFSEIMRKSFSLLNNKEKDKNNYDINIILNFLNDKKNNIYSFSNKCNDFLELLEKRKNNDDYIKIKDNNFKDLNLSEKQKEILNYLEKPAINISKKSKWFILFVISLGTIPLSLLFGKMFNIDAINLASIMIMISISFYIPYEINTTNNKYIYEKEKNQNDILKNKIINKFKDFYNYNNTINNLYLSKKIDEIKSNEYDSNYLIEFENLINNYIKEEENNNELLAINIKKEEEENNNITVERINLKNSI